MIVTNLKARLLSDFIKANSITENICLSDVEFVNSTMDLQATTNSSIVMRALNSSPNFKGSKTLKYNRYSIEHMLRGMKIPGKASDYPRVWDLIDTLREVYGLPFYREDFNDVAISPNLRAFDFRPKVNSIMFTPLTNIVLDFMDAD